ncbi:MAG: SRPBCC family protein [Chloroflexi bacterium]|nr:SRPBCC family protein [Chloroflexota bacterium]
MPTVHDEIEIAALVERVFAFVADHRNALHWMAGFEAFEPIGEASQGVGAAVRATGSVFGFRVSTTLRIVEFEPNRKITSVSDGQVTSRSTWTFSPTPAGTRVGFVGEYQFPGSNVPFIANRVVEELRALTRQSLLNLRARCRNGENGEEEASA